MSYLLDSDYFLIIKNAVEIKTGKIEEYYFSQYLKCIDSNSDFVSRLEVHLLDLRNQLNELKEVQIANMSIVEEKAKGAVFTDFRTQFDWLNNIYFLLDGRLDKQYLFGDGVAFTEKKLLELNEGFAKFLELTKRRPKEIEQQVEDRLKLKWKGSKTQLYYLLNKLKSGDNLILNKYEDLAKFVIENVEGYEDDSLITTKENLEKGKYPKKGENFSGTLDEIKDIE
jgi:hypothetical protein